MAARRTSTHIVLALVLAALLLEPPQARAQGDESAGQRYSGQLVTPVATAVVNMMEIAAQEALNPPVTSPLPRAVHSPLSRPEPGDPTQVADRTYFPSTPAFQAPSPSPSTTFNALDDSGTTIPPDTMGAVGTTRLLTMLNDNYRVQDKTGGVVATASLDSFWASTGATSVFDPRVLFDSVNSRWIVAAVNGAASANSSLLVGVSQSADPAGTWFLFRFDADAADAVWADFPTLGFNKNWIAVGLNMFTNAANTFVEGQLYVMDYAAARGGTSTTTKFNGGFFTMQPAQTHSSTENTLYAVEHFNSSSGTYRFCTVTSTPAAPAVTLVGGGTKTNPLGGWTQPTGDPQPQLGTATGINTGDARIGNAVFRGSDIWYTQTIGLPAGGPFTRTAVQWVKLDTSGTFVDGGRIDDPTATSTNGGAWYAYPSIAVNQSGDVLLGFGRFSSTTYASGAYAFRASADAAVTLTYLLDTGATVTRTKTVSANARLTVIVESEDPLLASAAMATQVTSDLPIVAERAMYWAEYPNWYEAHNAFGVTATALKWGLGEGRVGGARGYETYILLANPGATAAAVTVTFLREGGLAPIVQNYTVPATSRFNVFVNGVPGLADGENVGAVIEVTNGVPIAVERAMYSNSPSQPDVFWPAGTNATGTPIP